jgi:hypothetical protein
MLSKNNPKHDDAFDIILSTASLLAAESTVLVFVNDVMLYPYLFTKLYKIVSSLYKLAFFLLALFQVHQGYQSYQKSTKENGAPAAVSVSDASESENHDVEDDTAQASEVSDREHQELDEIAFVNEESTAAVDNRPLIVEQLIVETVPMDEVEDVPPVAIAPMAAPAESRPKATTTPSVPTEPKSEIPMEIQAKQQEDPQQAEMPEAMSVAVPAESQPKATTTPSVPTQTQSFEISAKQQEDPQPDAVQPVVLEELASAIQAIMQEEFKRHEQQGVCHWVYSEMATSIPASHTFFMTKQEDEPVTQQEDPQPDAVEPVMMEELASAIHAIVQEEFKRHEQQGVCHWVYPEMATSIPASHPFFMTTQKKQTVVFDLFDDNPIINVKRRYFAKTTYAPNDVLWFCESNNSPTKRKRADVDGLLKAENADLKKYKESAKSLKAAPIAMSENKKEAKPVKLVAFPSTPRNVEQAEALASLTAMSSNLEQYSPESENCTVLFETMKQLSKIDTSGMSSLIKAFKTEISQYVDAALDAGL